MLSREQEVPVSPHYIWVDSQERGLVVGRTAKNIFGNLLRRGNPTLKTEFLMCDPHDPLGVRAMNIQAEKRLARLLDSPLPQLEPDPKAAEIRAIVTMNRANRFRGLGLEPGAMLIGPIVLGEVVDWSREAIEQGMPITERNHRALDQAFVEFDTIQEQSR